MNIPCFTIKNHFQKRAELYQDIITKDILTDICQKLTGQTGYTVSFDNDGYNVGRLALLEFNDKRYYISFSELEIQSRNSSFQSFPSALLRYYLDENRDKYICFYFHPKTSGNFETPYFLFMYRLMKTAGVIFLNGDKYLKTKIFPFSTTEDIVTSKEKLRDRNSSNKSTYMTRGEDSQVQIFGKTYGANKYETTILCLAISEITSEKVELYQIGEGGLSELPAIAIQAISKLGKIDIHTSNRNIEREDYEKNDSLRSIEYIYNLLSKFGDKKCAFCDCEIPQIIQGAHIFPVSEIKKQNNYSIDEKLSMAIDGDNGLWLCQNHHKLLDSNLMIISENGNIHYKSNIDQKWHEFISKQTINKVLSSNILTPKFKSYLYMRNNLINNASAYSVLT